VRFWDSLDIFYNISGQLSIKERAPVEFNLSPIDPFRQAREGDEERRFLDGSLSVEKMKAGK
jgi:hypothetical protein